MYHLPLCISYFSYCIDMFIVNMLMTYWYRFTKLWKLGNDLSVGWNAESDLIYMYYISPFLIISHHMTQIRIFDLMPKSLKNQMYMYYITHLFTIKIIIKNCDILP